MPCLGLESAAHVPWKIGALACPFANRNKDRRGRLSSTGSRLPQRIPPAVPRTRLLFIKEKVVEILVDSLGLVVFGPVAFAIVLIAWRHHAGGICRSQAGTSPGGKPKLIRITAYSG